MIPRGAHFTISVAPLRDASDPWQDASGNWWTPGRVGPEGTIVSATAGQFIRCGLVLISEEHYAEARAAGWRISPIAPTPPPEGLIYIQL